MQIPGYRILRELGRGGMATVYLAEQESLGRVVALKRLQLQGAADAELAQRFLHEARTVAQLAHPHIVAIYDFGAVPSGPYLAMEYLGAGDLKQRIENGPLRPALALKVVAEVARALDHAHRRGIVHRDVKPENILFREDGSAVLSDFGIARTTARATRLTGIGLAIGTPRYMSPEQARGRADLDGRSDLYSLGVVLFEVLTGQEPYRAESDLDVVVQHVQAPLPRLPEPLRRYQPLIDGLMAKAPADRLPNAGALLREIEACSAPEPAWQPTAAVRPAPPVDSAGTGVPSRTDGESLPPLPSRNTAEPASGVPAWVWAFGGGAAALLLMLLLALAMEPRAPVFVGAGGSEGGAPALPGPSPASTLAAPTPPTPPTPPTSPAPPASQRLPAAEPAHMAIMPEPSAALATERAAIAEAPQRPAGTRFHDATADGGPGPELVAVPAGRFTMGSTTGTPAEQPTRSVTVVQPFALGRYPVTFAEYDRFAAATGRRLPDDAGWGRGDRPVVNVSWDDAVAYTRWLSQETRLTYRLPSEAEWEYAARGGTQGEDWWAAAIRSGQAHCADCGSGRPTSTRPVTAASANPFGLHDMAGNAWEWTQDCWHDNHDGAPAQAVAREAANCPRRVLKGASWLNPKTAVRPAMRYGEQADGRSQTVGFRVLREFSNPEAVARSPE